MPQYPLYSETPADKSISCVLHCTLIHEVRIDETELSKSVRQKQESRLLHPMRPKTPAQHPPNPSPSMQFCTQGRTEEKAGASWRETVPSAWVLGRDEK
jgi:hypothetical protein